jgi:hypothetical protein
MMIDLSLDELRFLRHAAASFKFGRIPPSPAAFGIIQKLDNIIVAAQCAEGQKYISQQKGPPA